MLLALAVHRGRAPLVPRAEQPLQRVLQGPPTPAPNTPGFRRLEEEERGGKKVRFSP